MTCGMCEAHVNDAIRRSLPVKKGALLPRERADHHFSRCAAGRGEAAEAVSETGYAVLSVEQAPYEKKGLFSCRR